MKQLANVCEYLEMRADALAIMEVQLLLHAEHEHIVKFFGVCFRGGGLCLALVRPAPLCQPAAPLPT